MTQKNQNKIEAKRIVQAFTSGVAIRTFFILSNEENVNTFLDLLIKTYSEYNSTVFMPENIFDCDKELHNKIVEAINIEFECEEVTPEFISSLPNIVTSLENKEIRELVFNSLIKEQNYNKIFTNIFNFSDDYDVPIA